MNAGFLFDFLVADALSALVRSSAEKESLRGMEDCWVGRGMVSVIVACLAVVVFVVEGAVVMLGEEGNMVLIVLLAVCWWGENNTVFLGSGN